MTPAAPIDAELKALRAQVEGIDDQLVALIAARVALARAVGELKHARGLPLLDATREAAVVRHAGLRARDAGVSDEPVRAIFWQLIELCRHAQERPR